MNDHSYFAGGAAQSTIHPVVLAIVLLAVASVLCLKRKHALAPVLVAVFLTPFGQQLLVAGFHLFTSRMIILAAIIRVAGSGTSLRTGVFKGAPSPLERAFFWWAFFRAITFMLLWRETGAVVAQVAFWLDAYGGYLLFRYFIQDEDDVVRVTKTFSAIAVVLAACMSFEYLTRVNLFNYIGAGVTPWVRDGKVRAQGVFANSITAGTFGATLAPLFFWLWKCGKSKLWGSVGLGASAVITFTSGASTPASAFLAGIMALCLWPIRKQMRRVRWGIVAAVIGLALVMNAPVWYLIARVDFVGGHGWDRAFLVDQTVRHVSSWWLLGSKDNASWGADTWDACNQFVAEAVGGGMVSLILFSTILSRAFGMIGQARRRVQGDRIQEWFFWCIGAALFAHVVDFFGIDYFDQTKFLWFAFLAMIAAATIPAKPVVARKEQHDSEFGDFMFAESRGPSEMWAQEHTVL